MSANQIPRTPRRKVRVIGWIIIVTSWFVVPTIFIATLPVLALGIVAVDAHINTDYAPGYNTLLFHLIEPDTHVDEVVERIASRYKSSTRN